MAEWANLGLNLWAVDEVTQAITAEDGQYDLASDTVDIIEAVWRVGTTDYRLARIGVGSWAAISNKSQQNSRPSQFYVERLLTPRVNLWPVPEDTSGSLVYWRLRRVQDAGTADKTMDVPYRFLSALTAGLAYKLAMKKKQLDIQRISELKLDYAEQLGMAMSEDRGREPFMIWPGGRR